MPAAGGFFLAFLYKQHVSECILSVFLTQKRSLNLKKFPPAAAGDFYVLKAIYVFTFSSGYQPGGRGCKSQIILRAP